MTIREHAVAMNDLKTAIPILSAHCAGCVGVEWRPSGFRSVRGSRSIAADISTFSISTRVVRIIPPHRVLVTVSGWLAPARDSSPLPGHLGHSGAPADCVSLD
jgi:hypothetical protein